MNIKPERNANFFTESHSLSSGPWPAGRRWGLPAVPALRKLCTAKGHSSASSSLLQAGQSQAGHSLPSPAEQCGARTQVNLLLPGHPGDWPWTCTKTSGLRVFCSQNPSWLRPENPDEASKVAQSMERRNKLLTGRGEKEELTSSTNLTLIANQSSFCPGQVSTLPKTQPLPHLLAASDRPKTRKAWKLDKHHSSAGGPSENQGRLWLLHSCFLCS